MITAEESAAPRALETADDDERIAKRCVIAALALAFAVNLPLMSSSTIFGSDDWAWVWVYRSQGAEAILHYMWDAAHPGYGIFYDLLFALSHHHAGQAAHIVGIGFHLAAGWLLWCIFRDARFTPSVAACLAILYVAAPFLADLHASLAHSLYDPTIFLYLLSIWLSLRRGIFALVAALAAMVGGLTIETLVVLEPIRWWVLYHHRGAVAPAIRRALPFAVLALCAAAIRVFWLKPEGIYQGYNAFLEPNLANYLRLAKLHLDFFLDVQRPIAFAGSLVLHDNPLWALVVAGGAYLASATAWRNRTANNTELAGLLVVGAIVLVCGMAPYIAIDRVPTRIDVSSRFAVASQFGALLLLVAGIHLLRFAPARALAMAGLVFVFMANQLQLGKWLLFEGQAVADFRQQVGAYLAHSDPQVLVVDFTPPARDFLYVDRVCLSSYDTNVSLELAGLRHHSFVFDRACGSRIYHNPAGCFITGYDPPGPCPAERRTAEFSLLTPRMPFTHINLAKLLAASLGGPPVVTGRLIVSGRIGHQLSLPGDN